MQDSQLHTAPIVPPSASLQSCLPRSDESELPARISDLESRLLDFERTMAGEQAEVHRLGEQNRQLQQEIIGLRSENEHLQQEISRLGGESAHFNQKIEELKARIAQLSVLPATPAQASKSPASSPVRPAPTSARLPAPASTPTLRQKNGQPITEIGQLVEFVGTCGYNGKNTPPEHQQDQTDTWIVVKIENGYAIIVKQNPIAVQRYKAGGSEARYDQSDLKVSVASWWSKVANESIGSFAVSAYALPVRLNGENQSSPFGYKNLSDQSNYQTMVDPGGSVRAFVPSYIDVNPAMEDCVAVGGDLWTNFVTGFSNNGNQYPNVTWLRSPLIDPYYAANIDYDGHIGGNVDHNIFALRPACWINI